MLAECEVDLSTWSWKCCSAYWVVLALVFMESDFHSFHSLLFSVGLGMDSPGPIDTVDVDQT